MLSALYCLALLLFQPIVIFSFNNSSSTELLVTKTTVPPNENQRMFYAIISGGNPWEIQKHDSKEFNKKVEEVYKQNLTDKATTGVATEENRNWTNHQIDGELSSGTSSKKEEIDSTVVTTVAKRGKHYDTSWRWGLVSGCAFFLAAIVIVLGWEHCGDEDQAD